MDDPSMTFRIPLGAIPDRLVVPRQQLAFVDSMAQQWTRSEVPLLGGIRIEVSAYLDDVGLVYRGADIIGTITFGPQ